jgi:hypothetical protein
MCSKQLELASVINKAKIRLSFFWRFWQQSLKDTDNEDFLCDLEITHSYHSFFLVPDYEAFGFEIQMKTEPEPEFEERRNDYYCRDADPRAGRWPYLKLRSSRNRAQRLRGVLGGSIFKTGDRLLWAGRVAHSPLMGQE